MGKLIRAISEDGAVAFYGADTTDIATRAERIHRTSAVVTAAMGRLMTAASIMGAQMKGEGASLTLRIAGDGPMGAAIAVSDNNGNVRAYVANPIVELPLNQYGKLDVGGAVGKNGVLNVLKDFGYGEPYSGQIPIATGEIAEDITQYYAISEQLPTICALGVLVNPNLTVQASGGYMAQLLPGAGEDAIAKLEANMQGIAPVSTMISSGMSMQDIMNQVLAGMNPQVLEESMVEYRCNCSRKRVERALISLGKAEITDMATQQPLTEVACHFCNKKYKFNTEELLALLG